MGHYVRVASYSPQTAAKTADFRLRLLEITIYSSLCTGDSQQTTDRRKISGFRLRLLEAPAYTAEPIKKNGFTSKLASALFLLTPVHSYFTT